MNSMFFSTKNLTDLQVFYFFNKKYKGADSRVRREYHQLIFPYSEGRCFEQKQNYVPRLRLLHGKEMGKTK